MKTVRGAEDAWGPTSSNALRRSASALAIATLLTAQAAAQDSDLQEDDVDTIVVQGIRQSIEDAQDLKQNADTFLDAITASDIGALPDRSVSEALQRVPGVSVLRFAGPDDPDHFAVEGSGVVIRGLPYVRSELNGRDVFGATNGGGLGFEDVSPELLGSVVVFKNQSADMIEGGLAGTVDLRTRVPFDADDTVIGFSVEATYGDFAEEWTPSGSVLLSDRWETNAGEFGILVSASHNELRSRADATTLSDFRTDLFTGPDDLPDGELYINRGGGVRTQEFDRQRQAVAAAAQWENPNQTLLATAQFLRSDATLVWSERVLESSIDDFPTVNLGEDFEFDEDNILTRGTTTQFSGGRENLPDNGFRQQNITRERAETDITTDYGFNLKWTPDDRWAFNLDAQYVDATTTVNDVSVIGAFFSDFRFESFGEVPRVDYLPPAGTEPGYFQDFGNYFQRAQMDHAQDSEAEEVAFRGDVEYDFDEGGFLRSARFGARYADRDTELRYSNFNWGNVSEVWTNNPNGLLNLDEDLINDQYSAFDFDNFQRGDAPVTGVPFWSGPLAEDYSSYLAVIEPILAEQGSLASTLRQRGTVDGGLFLPSEIGDVDEESLAFYGRLDFGVPIGDDMELSGNVGVRYVETDVVTGGGRTIQSFDFLFPGFNTGQGPDSICQPTAGTTPPGICSLSDAEIDDLMTFFGDTDDTVARDFENSYDRFLPSLNMKLDLGDGHLIRFGAARSMRRPQAFDLRSFVTVLPLQDVPGPDGTPTFQGLGATSGNPDLDPIMSNQVDLSYEWYFSESGSVTIAGFWKELEDFWIGQVGNPGQEGDIVPGGTIITEATNNGVTQPFVLSTIVNAEDSAALKGIEFSYQQFYDFLPVPFDGIGAQFNYTYIDANAIGELNTTATGRFSSANDDFERVSEHQFNLVGLYENDKFQGRVAYNWRDDFLLTRRDVIFPFTSIYQEATGQLDASLFYNVTDNIKIGVQGVNLLDDITETTQLINDDGLRAPRAFNRNDRRYSLILRGNF